MKEKITRAFDDIRADDALIRKTAAYLQEQRESRCGPKRRPRTMRFVAAFAASLVLVVGLLGYNIYMTPAAYVSVDVNPSIELTINRFNTVIGVYAFNAEGEDILQQNNVTGKRYDDAVAILMTTMERDGYFTGDALISMTIQADDSAREQALQDTLQQVVTAQTTLPSTADAEVFPVSAEVRNEAHGCHMSPAKYLAIQELLSVDETATLEQYSGESIRQIRQRTRECQGEHGASGGSGNGNGNNSGQSNGQEEGQSTGQGQGGGQGNGQGNGHHGRGYHGGN